MRFLMLLLSSSLVAIGEVPYQVITEPPCTPDTSAVGLRRDAVAHDLSYEDLSSFGLPHQPAKASLTVVTDSVSCATGLAALNALGGEPEQSVLILDLAGSAWAIVGKELLNDTLHFFTRDWEYLFTLHGAG